MLVGETRKEERVPLAEHHSVEIHPSSVRRHSSISFSNSKSPVQPFSTSVDFGAPSEPYQSQRSGPDERLINGGIKLAPPSHWLESARWSSATGSLLIYFAISLTLTIFNKFVLQGFPFAWTLTSIHMLCGIIGSLAIERAGYFTLEKSLTIREHLIMAAFSILYTVNIGLSSLSLQLVTITVSSSFSLP